MTSLDKTWFSPSLKLKYNKMQKEYFKNGKSNKWKKLRSKFRNSKRKASKTFYKEFVQNLKVTKPGMYYKMAKKKVGGIDQSSQGDIHIESIEHLNAQEQVEEVAKSFAAVSCEYNPVDISKFPAYLPAEEPPQLHVYDVYKKIQNQKKTRSTLPIDIPDSLRKDAAEFLAELVTEIFNSCLLQGICPTIWKKEWVTPVPKTSNTLKSLKDVRKISSTSDYSKTI